MAEQLNVQAVEDQLHALIAEGLLAAGRQLLDASNEKAPKDTGDLIDSGRVTGDGLEVAVSYGTDHAVIEHEDLTAHHKDGRTAKFLENAMTEQASGLAKIVADTVRAGVGS